MKAINPILVSLLLLGSLQAQGAIDEDLTAVFTENTDSTEGSTETTGNGDLTATFTDTLSDGNETTDSARILELSANVSCMAWAPMGACVWITCTYAGCDIDYSVKIKHYTPDAVVTAYPTTGESPWEETQGYSEANDASVSGGSNKEGTMISRTTLVYKNVDVIGSPGVAWIEALSSNEYICDPITTPFFPYMLSTLDPVWRIPTIEIPWTLLNIFRYVNLDLSSWGGVYPRIGFSNQGHDYKNGALAAQRAADITTRDTQPHLYIPMTEDPNPQFGQWPPGEVIEGDETTHKWQQLIPEAEADTCRVFPDINDHGEAQDPFASRMNQVAGYAYNLWRPYHCCEKKGAVLLYHTEEQ
ncbi:MAG: TIGR03756 family integrating conjugative element protein [Gammaproteobacteria bacterium]